MNGFTLASEARDFPEWHLGRPRFAVWAIALDGDAELDARLAAVRSALDGWLLAGSRRQPHLTLHVCGFPVAEASREDEFGPDDLQAQAEALRAAGPTAIELQIGAPFTFTSAACLAVDDCCGHLAAVRTTLHAARPGFDTTPWVPHVTAGLYAGPWPLAEVQARLAEAAAESPLARRVTAVDWMCYDSTQIGGPLQTLLRVDLATRHIQVPDDRRLRAAFA